MHPFSGYEVSATQLSALLLPLLSSSVFTADDGDVTCQTQLGNETFTVTGKGDTDKFSATTTLFKVTTVTVTATSTTTSTKTGTRISTSTTQIPTTAGFKFISNTVNSRSLNAQKRDKLFQKPHARAIIKPGMKAFKFPSKVQGTELFPNANTKVVQKTGIPVTKTVASMLTTNLVNTISTTTTLIPKDVSVTKSFTTSMKVTIYSSNWKTTTKSTTATKTKVISGPTEYAACQAENMFGPDFNSASTGYYFTSVLNNGPGILPDF
ncbi:hypothetical protein FOC1_g10006462 [Fusarium oxysporum f. sp. cubense race 1]|uniref:Uncharacterized protein n=1 Tax=Fusarium oxysporum f. sp. cubense (strain race 1) TaxID=1229664 RepID=N4UL82_FUSC1|nr:hypothetical protein FOC1_g10006462 [Fusarium oxysporum f. sp. cubense race 1]